MVSAEVINIGTEILLGDILNTNSRYLSQNMLELGINLYFHTSCGDNFDRINQVLDIAVKRSNIILITGGLGPTPDDITVEAIANYFNLPLLQDDITLVQLQNFYQKLNRKMPQSAIRQALKIEGAALLANEVGTAPCFYFNFSNLPAKTNFTNVESPNIIMAFPGVPRELYHLWQKHAVNILKEFSSKIIKTVNLKHIGVYESNLADMYSDKLNDTNPTWATYAKEGECHLKVTVKADSFEDAQQKLKPCIDLVKTRSKDSFYGCDDENLEEIVSQFLKRLRLKIACVESCSAGLLSYKLSKVSGASDYLSLNMITYSNKAKIDLLNVPKSLIEQYGAVSHECAYSMAENIKKIAQSDIGVSITGIAGPTGGTDEKPVGLVFVGLAYKAEVETFKFNFNSVLTRQIIQDRATIEALNILRLKLIKEAGL